METFKPPKVSFAQINDEMIIWFDVFIKNFNEVSISWCETSKKTNGMDTNGQ